MGVNWRSGEKLGEIMTETKQLLLKMIPDRYKAESPTIEDCIVNMLARIDKQHEVIKASKAAMEEHKRATDAVSADNYQIIEEMKTALFKLEAQNEKLVDILWAREVGRQV